jgi:hypothetical protein
MGLSGARSAFDSRFVNKRGDIGRANERGRLEGIFGVGSAGRAILMAVLASEYDRSVNCYSVGQVVEGSDVRPTAPEETVFACLRISGVVGDGKIEVRIMRGS